MTVNVTNATEIAARKEHTAFHDKPAETSSAAGEEVVALGDTYAAPSSRPAAYISKRASTCTLSLLCRSCGKRGPFSWLFPLSRECNDVEAITPRRATKR